MILYVRKQRGLELRNPATFAILLFFSLFLWNDNPFYNLSCYFYYYFLDLIDGITIIKYPYYCK